MINENELSGFLAGIYEHLKAQADAIYHLQRGASAVVAAIAEVHPETAQAYERHFHQFDEENFDRHTATLQSIDELIQKLKSGEAF